MRIGRYEILPDTWCWQVRTIKTRADTDKNRAKGIAGEEYVSDICYPGTFPQALETVLEYQVRDELPRDADLEAAVATVARLYASLAKLVEEPRKRAVGG